MDALSVSDLVFSYPGPNGAVPIFNGLSVSLPAGSVTSLIGASGSGKSTLFALLAGMLTPVRGQITVAGNNLATIDRKRRAATVGLVFQRFHLLPYLDVVDNVLAGAIADASKADRAQATATLEQLGLGHRLHHRPEQLSTGERQRCAIARALLLNPPVLLADEPTGNLDPAASEPVMAALRAAAAAGTTVVIATHDYALAETADLRYRLEDGALQVMEPTV